MDVNRCVCCREIIPEGRKICLICEQREIKYGSILQSQDATAETVEEVYEWIFPVIKDDEASE